ncbi:MAG: hypothetical protein KAS12_06400, partial [Candidatus Aenigmarchaeota archaeon]|nr:hypothetical protein [Candidatus Aenigmarchaeota archaeon]
MKYSLFFISVVIFLFFGSFVSAYPTINDVSLQSESIWLGETQTIFLNCTDNNSTNSTISDVFADITTTTASFPNNEFEMDVGGLFYLAIQTTDSSNFNKIGLFDIEIFCENTIGEIVNATTTFRVSNLSLE